MISLIPLKKKRIANWHTHTWAVSHHGVAVGLHVLTQMMSYSLGLTDIASSCDM